MGNTIILKPSPYTPLTTLMLGEVAQKVAPPGVFNVLSGGNAVGEALVGHPCVRHITFTGSIATGRRIMASCADTLKKLTLELGGNDPAIVLPGANISKIAPEIFQNFNFNSGQVCTAVKRLYVHESQYDEMVQQLGELAKQARNQLGDGMKASTMYGPINNEMQLKRIEALVDAARRSGAKIVVGGRRANPSESGIADDRGYFYEPTVVTDIDDNEQLVVEEQFGPVLPVLRYVDVDDALRRANDTEYGLGGSVWGPNPDEASAVLDRLQVGIAWLNCHNAGNMHTPWGAVKQSGIGVGGDASAIALKEYADVKTTWVRAPRSDLPAQPAVAPISIPELMRGVVWRGDPDPRKMRVETLKVPEPGADEVLIKVRACGICRSDLLTIRGEFGYGRDGFAGFVPGHEVSGTVVAVGSDVSGLAVGTKVACTFLVPCGKCHLCSIGEEELCPQMFVEAPPLVTPTGDKVWVSVFGGLAEYAVIKRSGVYALPDECESFWEEAATLGCAYITAMGAVRHSTHLKPGNSVCIIGAGGVGGALVQLAKTIGATPVVAVDVADVALEHATAVGADYVINSSKEDVVRRLGEITKGIYVDNCFVVIGKGEPAQLAINCIRLGGKVCLVGLHATDTISISLLDTVRKGKKIIGHYGGRPTTDMPALIDSLTLQRLCLTSNVTQRFTLEDSGEAFGLLSENQLQGRTIVVFD
eukprot:gnl/MRDRNA2_/MRDRNA2_35873_c0_seq1.p1 gnl/MRDRNA2_/MRDRNA2_35873_c0~~gnl/MRDRNA2_/MRDRNA2_35873_c0_seq1.p1  ORF type:complete len:815 (-),score=151.05 gnl/MRDRNA2_/MRDRNA2_35873_c0_seq1:112-2220(-)